MLWPDDQRDLRPEEQRDELPEELRQALMTLRRAMGVVAVAVALVMIVVTWRV
ncbi:morphogenic membrane protein MmpB [Streptomyces sp. NBC_01477]|uniref:morphogenic membrane protein MmpB n=1 Tax=Streptomyces sp. NBC_01477 TaxID=2976015 RepID=UPI002E30941C|nr:hypothetical protein [Streptomyces sp. NBC_01477]